MTLARSAPLILAMLLPLLAATMGMAPAATAAVASNVAHVTVGADHSGVATCQVLVVVRAVLILGLEDRLGLTAAPTRAPVNLTTPPPNGRYYGGDAECRSAIERLRLVYPSGEMAATRSTYVSGPPGVAGEAPRAAANLWRAAVTGVGSAAAICQHLVIVDSVIIAGGAHGLPTGALPGAVVLTAAPDRSGARAACSAEVGAVEVVTEP